MVLNPTIANELENNLFTHLNQNPDPNLYFQYLNPPKSYKESPEQYKARKESMAQRKIKKEMC